MKYLAKTCAALAGALLIAGAASADQITVETNKSKAVRLKHAAAAIVVGNPTFADVAVHNDKLIFVTGKTFGTTNLMVFDAEGRQIYSGDIVVTTDATSHLVVNRGGQNFTYDCSGNCRNIMAIGDDADQFMSLAQQNEALKDVNE